MRDLEQQSGFVRLFLELDFPAYQLLYGITFYYMTEDDIEKRNIPEKDRKTITKVGYLTKSTHFKDDLSRLRTL